MHGFRKFTIKTVILYHSMRKVTVNSLFYCAFFLFLGCRQGKNADSGPDLPALRYADSLSEARIDSAYTAIRSGCDTIVKQKAPWLADSLVKDSNYLQRYFARLKPYTDADEKVERVVRQLLADCDSSLLRETYRIARLQKRSKPASRTKAKVSHAARRS